MADDDNCGIARQLTEPVLQHIDFFKVEMVGRLVEQQDVRLGDPCPRQHGQPLPAAAQLFQAALAERLRHQHRVENNVGAPAFTVDRIRRQGGKHGVPHRLFHKRGGQMLVDDGLRQSAQPGDIATGRVQLTGKAIEQGGFAAAIGGDDADAVSRIHGEAEIGKKRLSQNDSEVSKRDDGHEVVSGKTDP
ncbi:hypothetical protein D3C72_984540 [compost metagenome]